MSFHTYAKNVRRENLSFKARRSAFRSCIVRYHRLIRRKLDVTYLRYSKHFGFDGDVPDAGDRLGQAIDALEKERNLFLEQLRLFDKKRVKEKMRGHRFPSKLAVEALYKCDWFEIRDNEE